MKNLLKILTIATLSNAYALDTQFTVGAGTGFMVLSGEMTSPGLPTACTVDENSTSLSGCLPVANTNISVGKSNSAKLEFNGFIFLGTEVAISDNVNVNANVQINSAKFQTHYIRGARGDANNAHVLSIFQTINPRYGFNANILATIPGSSFSVGPAFQYLRSSIKSNGILLDEVAGVTTTSTLTLENNTEYQSKVAIGLIFASQISDHFSLEMTLSSLKYSAKELRFTPYTNGLTTHLGAPAAGALVPAIQEITLDRKQKLANASIGLKYKF